MKNLFILGLALLSTSAKAETAVSPIDFFDLNLAIRASLPENTESAEACVEATYTLEEKDSWTSWPSTPSFKVEYTLDGEHCSDLGRASVPAEGRAIWTGSVINTEVLVSENIWDDSNAYLTQFRVKINIKTKDGLEYTSFGSNIVGEHKSSLTGSLSFTDRDGALVGGI